MNRLTCVRWLLVSMLAILLVVVPALAQDGETAETPAPALLTDPFLQLPEADSVYVVWFTEWEGSGHSVIYGPSLDMSAEASTTRLSRMAEDQNSRVGEQVENGQVFNRYTPRDIWRHEAQVTGLEAGTRVPYYVRSVADDGTEVISEQFTLQPAPEPGQPLTILLTSDHQLRDMVPANLQMAADFAGIGTIDAVFFAGDLVNVPDRASEWFDDNRGLGWFPNLQGNTEFLLERTRQDEGFNATISKFYNGGEIIQHAPVFPATGNHETSGRFNPGESLNFQDNDPHPRAVAEARYEQLADIVNPTGDPDIRERWIQDNSFNNISYTELFTLPDSSPGGETYYSIQYGDVYVISLFSTRIWRTPGLGDDARGKYREALADLNLPNDWGYGDFIFEDLAVGSEQYNWLLEQLESDAFQNARYQVVIMHQGPHGVGDNYNPAFAHPEQIFDYNEAGELIGVRYEYPIDQDILFRDLVPLLNEYGVDLVHQGHSHVWWRMQNEAGVNFLETSNVGNSFGCYIEGYRERGNVPNDERYNAENYVDAGDPHGLEPIFPSEFAPFSDDNGNPLPCIASNDMTVFTLLTTEDGMVRSYVYDTRDPETAPVLFDQFSLTGE